MSEDVEKKDGECLPDGDDRDFGAAEARCEITKRSERLRQAVKAAGGNQAVATRAGMHLGTMNRYIGGRDMKAGAMIVLAKACGVTLDWLATGEDGKETERKPGGDSGMQALIEGPPDIAEERFSYIPRYDVRASAGKGIEAHEEQIIGYVAFRNAWLNSSFFRNKSNLSFIEASGDSMEPTISDGDYLLVDTSARDLQNGKIYALTVNDRLLVKRIQLRLDGSVLVKSDNKHYDPELISADTVQSLHIVGQVIWHGGNVL